MNLEEILMDPVIQAALIALTGTLLLAVIGGFAKIIADTVSVNKKIGNTDGGSLSKQHESLFAQNDKLYMRGNELEKELKAAFRIKTDSILNKVDNINEKLIRDMADQEYRYSSLDKDQQKIMDHVEGIHRLTVDWQRVVVRNKELTEENSLLQERCRELEKENNKLKKELTFKKGKRIEPDFEL